MLRLAIDPFPFPFLGEIKYIPENKLGRSVLIAEEIRSQRRAGTVGEIDRGVGKELERQEKSKVMILLKSTKAERGC